MIRLIVAMDEQRGIAKDGVQPWHLREDGIYFKTQTMSHGGRLLMGQKTFERVGRPLPGRVSYVVSERQHHVPGIHSVHSLQDFLATTAANHDIWVIGGASLYEQTIGLAGELYVTHINRNFHCDQFFPDYAATFSPIEEGPLKTENGVDFRHVVYGRGSSA